MELLAILTTAKEAGFETGTIMSIAVIAWMLKKNTAKQVDKIVTAITQHNTRLGNLETDVGTIKKKLGIGPTVNNETTTTQGG